MHTNSEFRPGHRLRWLGPVILAFVAIASATAEAGTLKIEVDGFEDLTGGLMIAVFNSEDHFPSETEKAVKSLKAAVTADTMTVAIKGLPVGQYAVSLYHDVNGNGKLDTGLFGAPTEPYGFSNNARGFAGPPSYAATLVSVSEDETRISVTVE